ncbi:MAG: glycosyltransferase [Actinomycetota bacterium]|nr:glycosyltransferase [Actinomycetota bacterium]
MDVPVVCASVARARRAEAELLATAVATHHPGERLVALVVDDGGVGRPEPARSDRRLPYEQVTPSEIGVSRRAFHELALLRSGDDLAASLLPALVAHLCREGRSVVALDVRVALLAPLAALGARALEHGIVLVPRSLRPVPDDGRSPAPADAIAQGAFTPAVVAAGPAAGAALEWWGRSLRLSATDPLASPSVAQPALELLVQQFGAAIETDPGIGVGAWNAHERELSWSSRDGLRAAGAVVRVVDLVGFDPSRAHLLAAGLESPRVLLSDSPGLARLCKERSEALARVEPSVGRAPVLADGSELDERMRRCARRAMARAGHETLPDPFDPAEVDAFHDWLASPDAGDPDAPSIPRYLAALREERRDLLWHFPRVETVDRAHFRAWVESHGLDEGRVPGPLRAAIAQAPFWSAPTGVVVAPPGSLRPGVVLVGYLRAESGVGEAARLAHDALAAAGVELTAVVVGRTPSRQGNAFAPARAEPVADREVNLVWTSADQLPGFASVVGPEFFDGRYTVGYWAWETEELPAPMAASAAMLDEVWVPSRYVHDAVARSVECPVVVVPHPVVVPRVDPRFDTSSLGIPEGFRFLFTYDFLSSFARKNPLGLLEAFTEAFAPGDGPVLVLKSVNGELRLEELEHLRLAARGRRDVVVLDGYLSAGQTGALLSSCDCYVSLHRSEGFGLGLAEAMALGKPVVATGYSGNLDFMDGSCARLVRSRRVEVGDGSPPYDARDHWGEPDLGEAVAHLRGVVSDPVGARELGERGRRRVLARNGTLEVGRVAERRLAEIRSLVRAGYVSRAAEAVRRMR